MVVEQKGVVYVTIVVIVPRCKVTDAWLATQRAATAAHSLGVLWIFISIHFPIATIERRIIVKASRKALTFVGVLRTESGILNQRGLGRLDLYLTVRNGKVDRKRIKAKGIQIHRVGVIVVPAMRRRSRALLDQRVELARKRKSVV